MSNSYRIRTTPNADKNIQVYIDQDFEFLEILSLKILQSQIYNRPCSDYGVVVGRISVNNGFGIPNAKVSVFVPLTRDDSDNPIISDLYPYKSVSDINEDGYRYNLLPYVQQHGGHTPTGTFFDRSDVLVDNTLIEVYDKYYKFTARTNESGDYMIFGVPLGSQLVHLDLDLSDIGEFSLSPQDLIRMGRANESQVAGTKFKASTNLSELPQIVSVNKNIIVEPLWGQESICNLGITRCDFDLTEGYNIKIEPTAIFMGSIFSDTNSMAIKSNCKPRFKQGELCNLVAGPGEILAIRQTIFNDNLGRPVLEPFALDAGGQVIDENGTWLVDVPMNLDYVFTNEFGEQVLSNNPNKGIPTKAKYRFKIKWNQSPSLSEDIKRGYFLVPNVKEYGWNATGSVDPLTLPTGTTSYQQANKSYAFSLDWNEYANPQDAIDCKDTFFKMTYNKVYTVAQMIDQLRRGTLPNRFISVKNILDDSCESDNNRFPTNESVFRGDIIFLLFLFAFIVFRPVFYVLIFIIHALYAVIKAFQTLGLALFVAFLIASVFYFIKAGISAPAWGLAGPFIALGVKYLKYSLAMLAIYLLVKDLKLSSFDLPILLYDSCDFCNCKNPEEINDTDYNSQVSTSVSAAAGNTTTENESGISVSQFFINQYFLTQVVNNPLLNKIGQIMAGKLIETSPPGTPTCSSLVPEMVKYQSTNGDSYWYFTNSLTIAERINLFNTKAKYFSNDSGNNPGSNITPNGGGTNRIKVSFEPNSLSYHEDSIVFIMLTPDSLQNINAGDLLTFQDPLMSKDKNVTGATENVYGNNAITGTTIPLTGGLYSKTIFYADPIDNNAPNLSVTYNSLSASTGTTNYHKFPIDLEYFQVVTAMTYSNFSSLQGSTLPNSLNSRYLNNTMYMYAILDQNIGSTTKNSFLPISSSLPFVYNPLTSFDNYTNQICLILVRGVDPYSERQPVSYDLSKIFGYLNYGVSNCIVTGNYKLNQPITGDNNAINKFKNVKHNITQHDVTDTYSNSKLYHQNFNYIPSTIPGEFSAFTSNLPSYYSLIDNTTGTITTCGGCPFNMGNSITSNPRGRSILNTISLAPPVPFQSFTSVLGPNAFITEWDYPVIPTPVTFSSSIYLPNFVTPYTINSGNNVRGYYPGEIIEGGSMMVNNNLIRTNTNNEPSVATSYVTSAYDPTLTNVGYAATIPTTRTTVMRSDRLPASTKNTGNCGLSYMLQNNQNLGMYLIPDEGVINVGSQLPPSTSIGVADGDNFSSTAMGNDLIDSLNNCKDSVPLKCYKYDPVQKEYYVDSGSACQSSSYANSSVDIWDKGCYKFVTKIILSIPTDLMLLTEWLARINITFAACRNVFSHVFTNNWINGSLYAIAFKNSRFFDSQNQPYSEFCERVAHLDRNTNNFYYRSSPYHSGSTSLQYFCANRINSGTIYSNRGPQKGNLNYPTTLVDLGPRTAYMQELVMSDDYDGYVVNRTTTTTFGDVTDLLNIFIISRLASTSFIDLIFSTQGADIFSYFNKRWRGAVDGDYAQQLSTNSQLGVAEFSSENYPSVPSGQDPIYFNGGDAADGVFGVFFSADTQLRDFISPKRTIIVPSGSPTNNCTYSYFNVFTQEVPFYQWEVMPNDGGAAFDNIFGSQGNNWFTTPMSISIPNSYFSNPYQQLDRIDINDRYFQTGLGNINQSYLKGFFWGTDGTGYNASLSYQNLTNPVAPRTITVGAPFHFYFGLKKGASAWDRFARKWVDFENILD